MAFYNPKRMYKFIKNQLFILFFLLTACLPLSKTAYPLREWTSADLRALSAPDAIPPAYDIVAVYSRTFGSDLQIRLDILDLSFNSDFDIYIALDSGPGGTKYLPMEAKSGVDWDTLIVLLQEGNPQAYIPILEDEDRVKLALRKDMVPRVVRDSWNDTVIINLNRWSLPDNNHLFQAHIFITPSGSKHPVDSIGPVRFDSLLTARAPVLVALWNTFPAYTPAQALRRWDGAHTGPLGERHGLKVLLQAVQQSKVPLILLDLKVPTSLSALDYIGALPLIRQLVKENLLILPDAISGSPRYLQLHSNLLATDRGALPVSNLSLPDWALARAAADSRRVAQNFDLPASNFLYLPNLPLDIPSGYPVIFTILDGTQPIRWRDRTLIPLLSIFEKPQANRDGLSLEVRRALLELAASSKGNQSPLLILGGDLTATTWGDPIAAKATLQYIANHPWIQIISPSDIMAMRSKSQISDTAARPLSSGEKLAPMEGIFQAYFVPHGDEFSSPFSNPVHETAWQSYLSLFAPFPPEPDTLPVLRANYVPQVHGLMQAANWVAIPTHQADCDSDPDKDGENECILASTEYFAIFEKEGGRLTSLFTKSSNGVLFQGLHQLIAPTSQFLIGLGDPGLWDISAGTASDPAGVHGAFTDNVFTWDIFDTKIEPGKIEFISPDGSLSKIFTLSKMGLRAEYRSSIPIEVKIPLGIDPWLRFNPNWGNGYQEKWSNHGWSWGFASGPRVEIKTTGNLNAHPFTASRETLDKRENPNFEYPPGHFLPFPLALVEIQASGDFLVEINFISR